MDFFIFLHENFNKPVLVFLNSLTDIKIVGDIVYIFADLPIFIIPLFLIGYWIFNRKNDDDKKKLLFTFYAIFFAVLINMFIQRFVHLDRPETALEGSARMILKHIPDASFPSDHAGVSISFLTSLFLFGFYRYFYAILPFFIIMNLSRVIGGVHWPLDVLVGSFIGIFSSIFIYKIRGFFVFEKINNFILKIAKIFKL